MKKTFMGVKLRRLRAERGLSQIALAHALGLSPSYLNQLEQNQRPLTVSVLLKVNRALGVDIQEFSEDEEAWLIAGLRQALADAAEPIALPELQEVAAQMPALGRAVLALYRRHLEAMERNEMLSLRLGDPEAATPIGMGCKVCERERCPQRAFPYVGRALDVDENLSRLTPYGFALLH
jgi:transcriptional regulator with XRE-family HTH domain